jgi:predicted dehydrogenase
MSGDMRTGAPLAFAFLGCGAIARRHSKRLRSISGAPRFHASRDLERAATLNRALGGAGAFGSYDEALADPRVTCAVVATPPSSHLRLTLAALAAGKDVVVEKPAFLTSSDVDVVRVAATNANRMVLAAENYHYKPLASLLREVVSSGELGQVRFVHVNALKRQETSGWRADPTLAGGGALFEGGVHWVHFMAHLGLTVANVHGLHPRNPASDGPERSMLAVFEYEGGAVGTLAHSWEIRAPLGGVRFSGIYGTRGTIHFESNGLGVLVRGRRTRLRFPGLRDFLGFGAMWHDFVGALQERRAASMTLAHAQRDIALIEEVYRSDGPAAAASRGFW